MKANINSLKEYVAKHRTVLMYLALLLVMCCASFFYLYNFKGINIDYDDNNYSYFVEFPSGIFLSFFSGSAGFIPAGYPFLLIFKNTLAMITAAGLTGIMITLWLIFEIGKEYKEPVAGLFAATLYAFTPMIYIYAAHFLPETYIPSFLAAAILLLLKAEKHSVMIKRAFYVLSGFTVFLGVFFGLQGLFAVIAFGVLAITAGYLSGKGKEMILLVIVGGLLGFGLFTATQVILYKNPFKTITEFSGIATSTILFQHQVGYYLYIVLPIFDKGFNDLGFAPRTNFGLLSGVFILGLVLFLLKGKKFVLENSRNKQYIGMLPYSFAAVEFILYLMYGTGSIFTYAPIEDLNRLAIPAILLMSIPTALTFSYVKNLKWRTILMAATLIAYLYVTIYYVNTLSLYYTGFQHQYQAINTLAPHLRSINTANYTLYYNYSAEPGGPCFVLGIVPGRCNELLYPKQINFSALHTIFMTPSPLQNMSYYYYNSTYDYYLYVNK